MRKVIEYKMLHAFNMKAPDELSSLVGDWLDEFELYGTPFGVRDEDGDAIICQAMVKYEDS